MKALQIERSLARFAAARVSAHPSPLRLSEIDPPDLPADGWEIVRPRLSGICGSDLATVTGRSSRWFEPIVSFPFVPGHEVVADRADGSRVVVEPVLHCRIRGVEQLCRACTAGRTNHCERLVAGHLTPGLQTGYCKDTGGGWSLALAAHPDQLHVVPDGWTDEAAVMIEPTACAVHAALAPPVGSDLTAVVIGAGTIGLATIASVARLRTDVSTLIAVAKHPDQRRLAQSFGAHFVVEPGEVRRAVRRATGSWVLDQGQLTGGADIVWDCVGSADSIAEALAVVAPGGTIILAGMPGHVGIDLTALWQREIRLVGAYAYGPEPAGGGRHSFELAIDVVGAADLGQLVTAAYPLDRYADAIAHAAHAGRRGATKVVFDLRHEKRR
ncbi:MAG TPA: zinc-binding dehydrogenase [Acidimicrobiales bacterium]|jgi:threonine dehydrogenase-like Zn-dependent dehydrogenase|nr:zinc-binding dehydrogenase [Acidimicrobiales bacterium]